MTGDGDLTRAMDGPGRVRRAVAAGVAPVAAILFPDRRVAVEVAGGRYGLPLLIVIVCAALAALALGARLDLAAEVLADNAGAAPATVTGLEPAPAEVKTDREIAEATAHRTAVTRVRLGLAAGLTTPARVLLLGFCLFVLGRFVGGSPTTTRALTAAALIALPGAVRSLLIAVAAWHQPAIGSADLDTMAAAAALPLPAGHPVLARLLGGVDLFTCWSVVILGFGLAAAAELKPTKAFVTAAIGFALYLLVTGLIMGGGGPPPGATG